MAHFEVIILNFNGARFLPDCLSALERLTPGPHTVKVNVVDNASSDDSKSIVTERFKGVNYIQLDRNLGFSGGNNAGVRRRAAEFLQNGRTADYFVFLNNDTEVDPNWLNAAADGFAAHPQAGIIGSKAYFHDPFLVVNVFTPDGFCPLDSGIQDGRTLGPFLRSITGTNIVEEESRFKFIGASQREGTGRWLAPQSTVYVPIADAGRPCSLKLEFANYHGARKPQRISISVDGSSSSRRVISLKHGQSDSVSLQFQPNEYSKLVQNAGSFINSNWEAGDLGFLKRDAAEFNESRQVAAICGVSMFIRAELFERLGGFDERFFAYYEDTDLSVRAQLAGYECWLEPNSTLLHVHGGTGQERSEYFVNNVLFSRLYFASKVLDPSRWWALVRAYYREARPEFARFEHDQNLSWKPHLRAMVKALKIPSAIVMNRIAWRLKRPEKAIQPLLTAIKG
jgi:GT2 family glycosyltransferase